MEDVIIQYGFRADVNVIIDKSLSGIRQHEFNQTLANRKSDRFNHLSNLDVKILHCNSKTECGIQVSDIVAGCVYQHYARYGCDPTPEYNYFPQIYERSTVKLDFFEGRQR